MDEKTIDYYGEKLNYRGVFYPDNQDTNIIMDDINKGDCWIIRFNDDEKQYRTITLFYEPYIVEDKDTIIYEGTHVFFIKTSKKKDYDSITFENHEPSSVDITFPKYDKKIKELEDKIENIKKEVSDKIHDILNKNDLIIRLLESHQ